MRLTMSGDYKLPSRVSQCLQNAILWLTPLIPKPIKAWILRRHGYYQIFENGKRTPPGSSRAKWTALHLPTDLSGKSVIDIGCSEGFFCLECAKRAAASVIGIDVRLTSLVCAKLLALKNGANIKYRVAAFPHFRIRQKYDYVLCLSLLHHLVSTKDIWKLVAGSGYSDDKRKLQQYLHVLCSMTKMGGACIIEMPYEYEDPDDRQNVDFRLFTDYLLQAGFTSAEVLGQWEHTEKDNKDRVLYVGIR